MKTIIEIRDKYGNLVAVVPHGTTVPFDPYLFNDGPYKISHVVVADEAGIKSAPPQETADRTSGPVADGGAEPL